MLVAANITTASGVIDSTERAVYRINDSIASVNLILEGDGNVAEFTDGGGVDPIGDDVFEDIAEGSEALTAAADITADAIVEMATRVQWQTVFLLVLL